LTLVEILMAITISGLVLGPVGGWMILTLNEQAPTAGRFNDAAQSRLLNTYVTRDIASAEHVITQPMDPGDPAPTDCTGGSTPIDKVVLNVFFLATEEQVVVYAVGDGVDGKSLYRRTCELRSDRPLVEETEVVRGVDPDSVDATATADGRTVNVSATLAAPPETQMTATATRRASLGALSGANGTVAPVARITQVSRTERSGGEPLRVALSARESWDLDNQVEDLTYSWNAAGALEPTSTEKEPEFRWTSQGEHLVALEVTDPQGNVATTAFTVQLVNQPPVIESASILAANGTSSGAVGELFTFDAVASDPDGGGSPEYRWRIPGGHEVPGAGTEWAFPAGSAPGLYDVVLEVSDGESTTARIVTIGLTGEVGGGTGFDPARVNVVDGPGRIDGHTTATQGLEVTFTATDQSVFAGWELLNGSTQVATGTTPVWSYDFPAGSSGVYTIRQNRTGGAVPIDEEFRINRAPVSEFVAPADPGAFPQTVQFQSTGTDDGGALSWSWNFGFIGPGWTSTLEKPQFTYTNPGAYTVTLTVTDSDGVEAIVQHVVTVAGAPLAPALPRWVGGSVAFDPIPGAAHYRIVTTHTGFEADGTTQCTRPGVNSTLDASGPFQTPGGSNTCPVGPKTTSATLAVEANGLWGPPSLPAVRTVP
jgi:hypothetical protein